MTSQNYLPNVKDQYEDLPYPPRDPQEEKTRLLRTPSDYLEFINHVGFKGKQTFKEGFRCLVAGGGTGDAVIHLAEQLKDMDNAEVVHLDLSNASIGVCKERAEVRGLKNIQWVQGSLLDVADLDIGAFDYINSCGVLHHLESPVDGLNALKSVLKDDGIMGIMVYGAYGRIQIYPMQQAMRYINKYTDDKQEKLDNTKKILAGLPENHFAHLNGLIEMEVTNLGDSGLYDLLLHSQDRAYTVLELYEWVEDKCGLHVLRLFDEFSKSRCFKPETYIQDQEILKHVRELPLMEQQALAEILNGAVFKHHFYVGKHAKKEHSASLQDMDAVPFFFSPDANAHLTVAAEMQKVLSSRILVLNQEGRKTILPATAEGVEILKCMDGKNSIAEVLEKAEESIRNLGGKTPSNIIKMIFEDIFSRLNDMHNAWLRSKEVGELR